MPAKDLWRIFLGLKFGKGLIWVCESRAASADYSLLVNQAFLLSNDVL